MVYACCCRGCTWSPARVPVPVLCGTLRLCIQDQYDSRHKYHRSHRHHRIGVYHDDICTYHISAVAIPEFIFWPYLVYDTEIWWPSIQGSGSQRCIETCELEHGAGADATCYGRDRRSEGAR